MDGVFVDSSARGLGPALMMLNALGNERLAAEGLAQVGGLIESQTKDRIANTKTAPDGTPWAPWSERYAASRRKGHSLLVGEGSLRDSIVWELDGDELRIGSNLVYAAIHQFGGADDMPPGPAAIPARAYLGLSDADVVEIEDELEAWIGRMLH